MTSPLSPQSNPRRGATHSTAAGTARHGAARRHIEGRIALVTMDTSLKPLT